MSFLRRQPPHPDDLDNTDEENDGTIDPELRLRTVRTAASAIAESIRSEVRAQKRKTARQKKSSFFRKGEKKKHAESKDSIFVGAGAKVTGARRNVYVNHSLSATEVDHNGEPTARYARNKVRTSKYTLLSFLPMNLFEQFQRISNIYFLSLVILSLFPIFGAASAQTAMLPILFILTVTGIKDGVEDYRRATLDEEVNTSATTKLGDWRNVNQRTDPRPWFEKILGINAPGKVTKGVRKLREKDVSDGIRVVLERTGSNLRESGDTSMNHNDSSISVGGPTGASGRRLEDIQSVDSNSYPPHTLVDLSKASISSLGTQYKEPNESSNWDPSGSMSAYQQSHHSKSSIGVVDWRNRTTGMARWERTLWKKLEVGDVVLLRDNEQVPADIVVLSTSDADGMCYLETKNLDGETNLKPRKAVRATSSITAEEDVEASSFVLDSEPPHANLYVYHGVLRYKDAQTNQEKQESVGINELLLRGCAIRNTAWIVGLVVFTGADTKIMLNGGVTKSKRSKIEKETNFNVIVNFVVLTLMCTIAGIFSGLQDAMSGTSAGFFEVGADPSSSSVLNGLVTFVSCLIAFQNIVPVSLYISIEIVKTIQAYFISQDIDMYYAGYDTPCVPKTWNISDDLGQIEYVFSDKTGTLTQNIMEFQKCSVHGITYGEGVTEAQRGAATRQGKADTMDPEELNEKLAKLKRDMITTMERTFKNRYAQPDKLTLVSPKLALDLGDHSSEQRSHLIAFFRALAICHSVLADRPDAKAPFRLEYKAESPDEAALVAAARDAGFPFVGKTKDHIDIEVMGQAERYTPLRMLEFNSTRKRMSVVVRCPNGQIILYCKGADSVIYERLAKDHDGELKEQTQKDMEFFANSGLRTLCIAYRHLTEEEFLQWSRIYDAATNSIHDRDEEINKANEMIEHSLQILGATALEDKLQEGVPEAIETLHNAGIKLWILTGDKLQTAIEIGYSCNLLKSSMDLMILSADSAETARLQIEAGLNKIASVFGPPTWDPRERGFVPGAQTSFAVVIDGDTLRHALTPELKPLFLNLATQCETVVCCRVSPAQKALTVKLVKEGRKAMTLSIGDGANDVAMIQEANIGCGLFGLEGSQAAMSADYAFGQFRFLTKLLLVHGRWSYQRIADMHSNFFYKNIIWTFAMFWYLPFNSFDATYLYQYTFILLYNLIFTALPVIALGAFDQDINAKAALAFPQLYVRGIRGLEYTRAKFWFYMLDGLYQSAVVFFFPYMIWSLGLTVSYNGKGIDSLADFGTTVAVAAIFAANTYVGINTNYWTIITWVVVFGSSIVMLLWIIVYSFFRSSDFVDEVVVLFGNLVFWTAVVFSVFVALAPRFLVKYFASVYMPLDKDIVREMWVQGDLKDRLGFRHRKAKRNRGVREGGSDVENAPMFHEPHARSASEISLSNHPYQPAPTSNPNLVGSSSTGQTPDSTPIAPPSNRADLRRSPSQDSVFSHYSTSDLPPPSPPQEPIYRLPSGEFTRTPPPRRISVSSRTTRASTITPIQHRTPPSSMRATSPETLRMPTSGNSASHTPGTYEMRVRNPQEPIVPGRVSRGSEASSFATANDEFYSADEDGDVPDVRLDNGAGQGQRDSLYSWDGGHAL